MAGVSQRDSTELVYLRARYYNPAGGRFLSSDMWEGNYNRPASFNRWNYAEANPINLIDPTGNKPLSTGYMEGYSEGGGLGEGYIEGKEIVYDYATMTRARFTYTGKVGGILSSVGWAIYVGPIMGFGYQSDVHSTQIKNDYEGLTTGGYSGAGVKGLPNGVGVSGGVGFFQAQTSNVRGIFTYFSAGAGLLPFEIVGFESTYHIDPQSLPGDDAGVEFYADASGHVNRGKLISDILIGDHSPIGQLSGIVLSNVSQSRLSQISAVLIAADFFEDYHQQIELLKCAPHRYGPPEPMPNPFENLIPLPTLVP